MSAASFKEEESDVIAMVEDALDDDSLRLVEVVDVYAEGVGEGLAAPKDAGGGYAGVVEFQQTVFGIVVAVAHLLEVAEVGFAVAECEKLLA